MPEETKVQLNLFTNYLPALLSKPVIFKTADSFYSVFGNIDTVVWCDTSKDKVKAQEYLKLLRTRFTDIHETNSLSDGYVQAIKTTTYPYLFMLEHDWLFRKQYIKHSLSQITGLMSACNIVHLRFNKRYNIVHRGDKYLHQKEYAGIPYCLTPMLSNNPHFINTYLYKATLIEHIVVVPGSLGIEERLSHKGMEGAVYGSISMPNTIVHLDGKHVK
jgi:hypothetical protein